MDANLFKTYSVTCPICYQTSFLSSIGIFGGLFTCPHCKTHFVISNSGHFVRDPFCLQKLSVGQMLRRQSHPIARISRDLNLTRKLSLAAIVGGLLVLTLMAISTGQFSTETRVQPETPETLED
ncbi:MAG: hypothetical protein ACFBSC_13720 [Microcoleaceae cyanobacterium]